jgi:hypothetical protein
MLERPDRQIKAAWRAIGERPGADASDPGSEPQPVARDAGSKPQPVAGLSADQGTEVPTTQPEGAAAAGTTEPDASTSEAKADTGQASSDRKVAGEETIQEPAADSGPAHKEADQSATKQAVQTPEREEDGVSSASSAPARLGGHPRPVPRRYAAARARLIAARTPPAFDPKLFMLEQVARKMP